ncbi:MAG: insulinase family protein [Pseudomonadota bacterium]
MTPSGLTPIAQAAGDRIGGYTVSRVVPVAALNLTVVSLEHAATGARHIHLAAPDKENTFSVMLRTVPRDGTGVAHILEHTVLCGSAAYPVRDPFFSMLRRSLSTFMNAFTASDWTMYPFSTQNAKDYYNLMDVYLDAVFFPKLDALSFMQEGHRLEVEDDGVPGKDARLVYKGVVFNEMKGAMSSPDQVMAQSLTQALYPDTTYRFNSGGDPAAIPELTHEDLVAFHHRHYHPSNAFFYTYGNLPLEEHLRVIEARVLSRFERIDPGTEVPAQPRWTNARSAVYPYPAGREEDLERKHQACVAWLCSDIRTTFDVLSMVLLEQILMGNTGAPLRRALMDTGWGSALSDGSGYEAEHRDTLFSIGLKDVAADKAGEIAELVMRTLEDLTREGIDPELVEGAIHQLEFHRREVRNTPYPHGIRLLLGFCSTWVHDGDPVRILQIDADLETLRRKTGEGRFFEALIETQLINNPHRVMLTLSPDPEMAEREARREAQALRQAQAGIAPERLQQIRELADALRRRQETEEDVSVLPTLEITDIPAEVVTVAPVRRDGGGLVAVYEQPTAGICYGSWALGVAPVSEDLVPLIPFFCYALPKSGTARRDYVEMARLIDRYTGGFGLSVTARTGFGTNGDCLPMVTVSAKCLARNIAPMMDIAAEVFTEHVFSDHGQLKRLLMEYRAGLESMVVQNGHRLAMSLASRRFYAAAGLNETWGGVHQLLAIKALSTAVDDAAISKLAGDLKAIGRSLFQQNTLTSAAVAESGDLPPLVDRLIALGRPISTGTPVAAPGHAGVSQPVTVNEGWHTQTSVSFVGAVCPTVRLSDPDAPALSVAARLLRSLYLHREIREKGGAYGGFAVFNPEDGLFGFASYRDPHVVQTLKAFAGARRFIRSGDYTDTDITEAILQVCSEIDKPDAPGAAARKAFYRDLVGLTDDMRRRYKEGLLSTTRSQVKAAAGRYLDLDDSALSVAVIASEEKLTAVNLAMGDRALELKKI